MDMATRGRAALSRLLPRGRTLPPEDFGQRHRALLALLWAHVAALPLFGLTQGVDLPHALLEGAVIAAFAGTATLARRRPRLTSVVVSVGLMACSAELVHLWDGRIEAHFHFFVMVSLLALYEDWLPFGLAFGFVVVHHGTLGALAPRSVYDHPGAWTNPWGWALIHGGFVAAAGVAGIVAWRLNETTRARMAHQALHDPLTRLPNRELFADRLTVALARARRSGRPVAVMFIDLDHFKVINDSLGHRAGDSVLLEVGARLDGFFRSQDTVARFGGDEFTVLVEDLASDTAASALADRIIAAVARPVTVEGRTVPVSLSVGIALAAGHESAVDLLRDADAAMYRAKERGRGRVEIFDEALRDRVLHRLDAESELRLAIEREELRVLYQPKVCLGTERIVGVEALVRWEHPTRGLVAPNDFIPLAEDTGLIVPLGRWVLREACREAAGWQAESGVPPATVSVNLSRRQLAEADLIDDVTAALTDSGLPAGSLCLEITETTIMGDLERSVATLLELRRLGVKLAIDDFGVGFSSLSQLTSLPPVDILKIDKSFIDHVVDADHRAIVAAILSLAHALGLTAIAEGVEDRLQADELNALGCEVAQGYLFSKPVPPAQLLAMFAASAAAAQTPA